MKQTTNNTKTTENMYDYNLLTTLYKIHSQSGKEKKLRRFVENVCKSIKGVRTTTDRVGNLYVTKGDSETYPCIVSHLDQVQQRHGKDFDVIRHNDTIIGYSDSNMMQQGLGADDKNGVWVCIEILRQFDCVKCAFFVGEEIGCIGSTASDLSFFENCRYILQCDRRNGDDLITDICGGLCSEEFLQDIDYLDFGYKPTHGLMTDIETLRDRGVGLSSVNISCGYYAPHTDEEVTVWSELCNCRDFVAHIVDKLTDVYPYTPERQSVHGTDSYYIGYDGDDYEIDYSSMYNALYADPYMTFDELITQYDGWFFTEDKDILRRMYEEAQNDILQSYFHIDTEIA